MSRAAVLARPDWAEAALEHLCNLAVQYGSVTADDLRTFEQPENPNQIGVLFRTARRRGLLTAVEHAESRAKSRHGGALRRWAPTPALMQAGGL